MPYDSRVPDTECVQSDNILMPRPPASEQPPPAGDLQGDQVLRQMHRTFQGGTQPGWWESSGHTPLVTPVSRRPSCHTLISAPVNSQFTGLKLAQLSDVCCICGTTQSLQYLLPLKICLIFFMVKLHITFNDNVYN